MSGAWDVVSGLLGFGGPTGNDHGSSNWAAWGHQEIRDMLDHSVDSSNISEAAHLWRSQGHSADDLVTGLTRDLTRIVSSGWRGASADAALAPLTAINQWSAGHTDVADRTSQLMADSGSSAAQAKASVPPPRSHDWGESLRRFATSGPAGALIDAVAQEQAQSDAHAEAVRVMTSVYSSPINDNRAAVPTYTQLADPTRQPAQTSPTGGSVDGTSHPSGATPGHSAGPSGSGHGAHTLSAATALQAVTGAAHPAPHVSGGVAGSDQAVRGPAPGGGQIAAAATAAVAGGLPIMAPIADNAVQRARAGVSGARGRFVAGQLEEVEHASGSGRPIAGHPAEFGPRPSGAGAEIQERMGAGASRGAGAATAGRAGAGEMMAPMAGGHGTGGEDSEHRRPSYLLEMDDIFADGRKVAPAVIGDDSAGQGGS